MQIRNPSEVTTKKPYGQDFVNNDIFMSREIYNHLKSIFENEIAKIDSSSYGEFLQDMSALHEEIINGSNDEEYPAILIVIDMYLGSLGVDNVYPLKKDMIKLKKFINTDYELPGDNNGR